jgi:thiol:disulfide interchange protein DsbD
MGEIGRVILTVRFPAGWHLYASSQAPGGPIATKITLAPGPVLRPAGAVQEPEPEKINDPGFGMIVRQFNHPVAFALPVTVAPGTTPGPVKGDLQVTYQVCTNKFCLPPSTIKVAFAGQIEAGDPRIQYAKAAAGLPPQPGATAPGLSPALTPGPAGSGQAPVPILPKSTSGGLARFLLLAVLAGILALGTPCVFPMIPITVSYFAKQQTGDRKGNVGGALVYSFGIVATFTALGLILAGLFGASGIQKFATNPWVNLVIAAIFLGLALNLMGYFEIGLPASLAGRVTSLSGRGGFLGTLLMGLTFTLTSFTCTMPFVGTLLVSTTQGSWIWPALGMLAFSSAFAFPFFILALFPGLLARLPRAGSWMVALKVYMGFLEIAAAVKFLSNADLVWQAHMLTRTVFLVIWAALLLAGGLYLLGKLQVGHSDHQAIGPARRLIAIVTLASGLYFAAALLGAPLGPFEAYVPPAGYGFAHHAVGSAGFDQDLGHALLVARAENRPLFLDFTGVTCTNCRWMEANVFPNPRVQSELAHFVLVELYTDRDRAGDTANRQREQQMFQTVALPLYAVLTPDGRAVAAFPGIVRTPEEFAEWLADARTKAE